MEHTSTLELNFLWSGEMLLHPLRLVSTLWTYAFDHKVD